MNYVLTYYHSTNHGTVAQAQCAAESTGSQIINYTPEARQQFFKAEAAWDADRRQTLYWPLPLTQPFKYKEEAWEFLDDPFKTVWVGSDEVLKFDPRDSRDTPYLQGYPTVFYLPDWVRCRKIMLAGCLGVEVDFVPKCFYHDIGKRLDGFEILSVRDTDTWEFVNRISRSIANRTELIPDPTWTLYPNTLELTPLKHYKGLTTATSYHRLIAMLMEGRQPQSVTDKRRKTQELAQRFRVESWDQDWVSKQCRKEQEAYQAFVEKVQCSPMIG